MQELLPYIRVSDCNFDKAFRTRQKLQMLARLSAEFDLFGDSTKCPNPQLLNYVNDSASLSLLDYREIIDNTYIKDIINYTKNLTKPKLRKLLGLPPRCGRFLSNFDYHLGELLRERSIAKHKQDLAHRLHVEIIESVKNNWFMVFDTLTVDNSNYDTVFSADSPVIRDYLRKIDRIIAKHCYGSYRNAQKANEDYCKYFLVFERGSETNRYHCHVMHFFKDIPPDWQQDPNLGTRFGDKRTLNNFSSEWTHGFSMPIAVRFSQADAWAKLGWTWPASQGKPLEASNVGSVAGYLIKYVGKIYNSFTNTGDLPCRTRISRNLGLQLTDKLIRTYPQMSLDGSLRTILKQVVHQSHGRLPLPSPQRMRRLALRHLIATSNMNGTYSAQATLFHNLRSRPSMFQKTKYSSVIMFHKTASTLSLAMRSAECDLKKAKSFKLSECKASPTSHIYKQVERLVSPYLVPDTATTYGVLHE